MLLASSLVANSVFARSLAIVDAMRRHKHADGQRVFDLA
jgi:hypothetical protein